MKPSLTSNAVRTVSATVLLLFQSVVIKRCKYLGTEESVPPMQVESAHSVCKPAGLLLTGHQN